MLKPSLNAVQDVVRAHADDIDDKRRFIGRRRRRSYANQPQPAGHSAVLGDERHLSAKWSVSEAVAMVDGSAGWCAAIGAGSNVFAGYLPEAGARHVFAENRTMFARPAPVDVKGRVQGDGPLSFTSTACTVHGLVRCHRAPRRQVSHSRGSSFVPLRRADAWRHVERPGPARDGKPPRFRGRRRGRSRSLVRFSDRHGLTARCGGAHLHGAYPCVGGGSDRHRRGALDEVFRLPRGSQRTARQLSDDPIGMAELTIADTDLRAIRAALLDALDEAHACASAVTPSRSRKPGSCSPRCGRVTSPSKSPRSPTRLGGAAAVYAGSRLLRALLDVQTDGSISCSGISTDRRSAPRWPGGTSRIRHSSCRGPTSRIAQVNGGLQVISSADDGRRSALVGQRGVDAVIARSYEAGGHGACSSTATATARVALQIEQWPWFRKSPIPSACR